ncbi:MAG TPA: OmpA family protein [Chlorobiota bacterium]|nr:OmpA family protein [Chlorobiota bacterium]
MRRFALLMLVTAGILSWTQASAQRSSIGVKGGYLHVMNTSTISIIPGSTDCGTFRDGTSAGLFAGLTGEYALLGDVLEATAAIVYSLRPATLVEPSNDNFEVLDPTTNSYVPLQREHTFTSSLGYVAVELGLRSRPFAEIPVYIRASFDAGNAIVDGTYSQTERIVSPESVLFPNDRKTRTTGSGEIVGLGTAYGVGGAIGGVLPLGANLELCPEVGYRLGLNSLISTDSWKQSMISGGIQLRYRFGGDEAEPPALPPEPPRERDTTPPPIVTITPDPLPVPPVVITSVSTTPLEIRETVVTQTYPLLPYVFFDSASATLPNKYVTTENTATFSEVNLPKKTLPIYYRMFDIIGKRMADNPSAVLIVTGTTDGREDIRQRDDLARRRAEAVVDRIAQRWNLPRSRFVIRTVDKPTFPTSDRYLEGIEENRRVELSSATSALLAPVVHTRFKEYVPIVTEHTFSVSTENPALANQWDMVVSREAQELDRQGAQGAPPESVKFTLTQTLTEKIGPMLQERDRLRADLQVVTADTSANASTSFPVIKTVSNYEVSRLSLIVFDFDQAGITEQNRQMMNRVVAASATPRSTATIRGSTDRLGELRHNMELSSARAKSVESYLRSTAPQLKITEVVGTGPSELPYDNTLPEGRFYCRTVSLTITTPLREP